MARIFCLCSEKGRGSVVGIVLWEHHVQAEGQLDYIGRIVEFFESTKKKPYIAVKWFFRAEDTVIQVHSDQILDNPLDCIVNNITVVQSSSQVRVLSFMLQPQYDFSFQNKRNEALEGLETDNSTCKAEQNLQFVFLYRAFTPFFKDNPTKTPADIAFFYKSCISSLNYFNSIIRTTFGSLRIANEDFLKRRKVKVVSKSKVKPELRTILMVPTTSTVEGIIFRTDATLIVSWFSLAKEACIILTLWIVEAESIHPVLRWKSTILDSKHTNDVVILCTGSLVILY